jgi:integrase
VRGTDGEPILDGQGRPVREFIGWEQKGKAKTCWDLRIHCDGHRWFDRHYSSGHATAAKERLVAGFAKGLPFDPVSKKFLDLPPEPVESSVPTVFTESVEWWRTHWTMIEPKSRKETLRYISRPVLDFVGTESAPPPGLAEYLRWQLLPPKASDVLIPPEYKEAAAWLCDASIPVGNLDASMWQSYIDRWKINTRTGRPLAQSSVTRHLADVRQLWAWVCATHGLKDPWPLLRTRIRSSAGGRRGSTVRPVDRSVVLSPDQVRALARICGELSFGPMAEAYVLLLGVAGGRPGESIGVEYEDLELSTELGEVTYRRTNRRGIEASFLDPDDDAAWGPLKGREIEESRTVPIPARDAERLRALLAADGTTGDLFPGWDWDKFSREVWEPAKAELASRYVHRSTDKPSKRKDAQALQEALGRLRLHDLRHAACSMWLNTPGVEVKVACEWSGHKRLSVFLDIYQGVMPGAKTAAAARLNATW